MLSGVYQIYVEEKTHHRILQRWNCYEWLKKLVKYAELLSIKIKMFSFSQNIPLFIAHID